MKSFVRAAVLVSLVWFPSVHAAQPSGVPPKGPVVVKQSPLLDLESWFRDKIRRFGSTIEPPSVGPETNPSPTDAQTACTAFGIDRTKCPIG